MNYNVQMLCLCGFKAQPVDQHNGKMAPNKEDRMGGACGTNGGEVKSIQDFLLGNL